MSSIEYAMKGVDSLSLCFAIFKINYYSTTTLYTIKWPYFFLTSPLFFFSCSFSSLLFFFLSSLLSATSILIIPIKATKKFQLNFLQQFQTANTTLQQW